MNDIAIVASIIYRNLPLSERLGLILERSGFFRNAEDRLRTNLSKSELTQAFNDIAKKLDFEVPKIPSKKTGKDEPFEFGPMAYGIVESFVASGAVRRSEVPDVISYIIMGLLETKRQRQKRDEEGKPVPEEQQKLKSWVTHWEEAKDRKNFAAFMKNRLKTTVYNYLAERKRGSRHKLDPRTEDTEEGGPAVGRPGEEFGHRAVDIEGEQMSQQIINKIEKLIGGDTTKQREINKLIWDIQINEDFSVFEHGGATELAGHLSKKLGKPISPQLAIHYLKSFKKAFEHALPKLGVPALTEAYNKIVKKSSEIRPFIGYLYYLSAQI